MADTASLLTSEDGLLGGRLVLRQPREGFRAAIDPLFLAAAVPAAADDRVLDLGCGVGTAALALLTRVPEARATGLEIDATLVNLAAENARANDRAAAFEVLRGDMRDTGTVLGERLFDHVCCNPPHVRAGSGTRSENASRDRAVQEGEADLADWVDAALRHLRPKGSLVLVHRADRLEDLLAALTGRAGEIAILPLWPAAASAGRPAKRVLLRARKGVRGPTRLLPGLVLHQEGGGYTPEADAVLRDAAGLDF